MYIYTNFRLQNFDQVNFWLDEIHLNLCKVHFLRRREENAPLQRRRRQFIAV